MAISVKERLLAVLDDLGSDELKRFKWHLTTENQLDGFLPIPKGQLETSNRLDIVDQMVQKYRENVAVKITLDILKKISRNDLAEKLNRDCPIGPSEEDGEKFQHEYKLEVKRKFLHVFNGYQSRAINNFSMRSTQSSTSQRVEVERSIRNMR
ncbi:apoptosis-associated speck-like protein containing a CARD [Oncorhynchus tshawytscha]|uniref:Pyrin domain-containing protein n=1 Tax=Oncorhynchus tshawytscha TaxID=74940 RepID=A0AAZ3R356_ONCTS|nr:apoptosis-associated speck-like protein containing a CARD [Oncorhynchus tshawytscha]